MEYRKLLQKRKIYQDGKENTRELTLASYRQAFETEYTHNSTAIEGNSLTLLETKLVLEDGISIGGKSLREIYEQVNHLKAFRYVKSCIEKRFILDETIIREVHRILMGNILDGFPPKREGVRFTSFGAIL